MKTKADNGKLAANISMRLTAEEVSMLDSMRSPGVSRSDVIRAALDMLLAKPSGTTVTKQTKLIVAESQTGRK